MSDKEVDSLLIYAEKKSKKLNYPSSISISRKALLRSSEISYTAGIVKSKFWIASGFCNMGKYDKSLLFIKNIEKQHADFLNKDYDLKFGITNLLGRIYLALGLTKQAAAEFRKGIYLASTYRDPQVVLEKKRRMYIQLSSIYEGGIYEGDNREGRNKDSVYYYLNRHKSSFPSNTNIFTKENFYMIFNLANYHIYFSKNLDSASYYNNHLLNTPSINKSYHIYDAIFQKAKLLNRNKEYKESIKYCLKALNIAKNLKQIECEKLIYKLIAQNYNELGMSDKELYYTNQELGVRDILALTIASGNQISADSIYEELKQSENKSKKAFNISFALGFLAIFSILGIKIIAKKERKNNRIVISEREKELKNLNDNKLNDAKNELIILAKKNAPEFSIKFQEVYPELYLRLLEIQPDIKNSEVTFCAYLKLNFKTKEIATYLYVTPRAIEIRKNRLRKKFNISSEQDLYLWINNLN